MGIQIGAKPDSGFDDPIGMLKDCHRRIEHFLSILCVVVDRAGGRGLTQEEAEAVRAALHYFREGGRRHTADEEESLFPRLRAEWSQAESAALGVLEHDHREADELHGKAEGLYLQWINAGTLNGDDETRLASSMQRLAGLYRDHIALEEQQLFPRAAKRLAPTALAEMGQEFRTRRG